MRLLQGVPGVEGLGKGFYWLWLPETRRSLMLCFSSLHYVHYKTACRDNNSITGRYIHIFIIKTAHENKLMIPGISSSFNIIPGVLLLPYYNSPGTKLKLNCQREHGQNR